MRAESALLLGLFYRKQAVFEVFQRLNAKAANTNTAATSANPETASENTTTTTTTTTTTATTNNTLQPSRPVTGRDLSSRASNKGHHTPAVGGASGGGSGDKHAVEEQLDVNSAAGRAATMLDRVVRLCVAQGGLCAVGERAAALLIGLKDDEVLWPRAEYLAFYQSCVVHQTLETILLASLGSAQACTERAAWNALKPYDALRTTSHLGLPDASPSRVYLTALSPSYRRLQLPNNFFAAQSAVTCRSLILQHSKGVYVCVYVCLFVELLCSLALFILVWSVSFSLTVPHLPPFPSPSSPSYPSNHNISLQMETHCTARCCPPWPAECIPSWSTRLT